MRDPAIIAMVKECESSLVHVTLDKVCKCACVTYEKTRCGAPFLVGAMLPSFAC